MDHAAEERLLRIRQPFGSQQVSGYHFGSGVEIRWAKKDYFFVFQSGYLFHDQDETE